MSIHVCKQCGARFEYCRMCVFRPIRYKDAGFCSKECYEASKNIAVKSEPIMEEVITVEIEEPVVKNDGESLVENIESIMEEIPIEAETEEIALSETSDVETTIQIIENETDDINEYLVRE